MSSIEKLRPYYHVLDVIRNILIVMIFAFIVGSGAVQIFLRYTPGLKSFKWTTEILRYLNIWVVFLGASVGVKMSAHLEVDYFLEKLFSRKTILLIKRITLVIIFAVLILLIVIGLERVLRSTGVIIQAAPITIALFYLAVPFGCLFMLIDYVLIFIYGYHPFYNVQKLSEGIYHACDEGENTSSQ